MTTATQTTATTEKTYRFVITSRYPEGTPYSEMQGYYFSGRTDAAAILTAVFELSGEDGGDAVIDWDRDWSE